jgi:hypothetical protein
MHPTLSRPRPALVPFLLVLVAASPLPGCFNSAKVNEDRMLDEMRREIAEMTSDSDMDRLGVEPNHGSAAAPPKMDPSVPPPPPAEATPPAAPDTPALPVVHLGGGNGDDHADPASADKSEDGSAEPVLKFTNANIAAALKSAPPATVDATPPPPEKRQGKSKRRKAADPGAATPNP